MCGQALRFVREVKVADDLPVDRLIDQLMADQHLIMAEHTMAHWPTELYLPSPIVDRDNRENWVKAGGKDTYQRAIDEVDRRLARLPADRDRSRRSTPSCAGSSRPGSRPRPSCRPCRPRRSRPTRRWPLPRRAMAWAGRAASTRDGGHRPADPGTRNDGGPGDRRAALGSPADRSAARRGAVQRGRASPAARCRHGTAVRHRRGRPRPPRPGRGASARRADRSRRGRAGRADRHGRRAARRRRPPDLRDPHAGRLRATRRGSGRDGPGRPASDPTRSSSGRSPSGSRRFERRRAT